MKARPWTTAEEALLREQFATTSSATLALRLGRSWRAIAKRAHLMGLTHSHEYRSQRVAQAHEARRQRREKPAAPPPGVRVVRFG